MKRSLKILIVADVLTTKTSGGKASNALVQGFVEQGYDIKILHYSREDVNFNNADIISIPEKKNTWSYFKAKSQMLFQRVTRRNINHWVESRNGFSYTHDYDVKSIKAAINKESPEQYDYILALSYASSFRAHKAILQLPEWHEKFLPYIHDPYPMHSYPRPYDWVEPGHQKKRDFFVDLYSAAFKIIYPSEMLSCWMGSYYPTGKEKAAIIPHLISSDLKDTKEYSSYYEPSHFNILHAGSLMSARNPLSLVHAFVAFLDEFPKAKNKARLVMVSGESIFDTEMKSISRTTPQIILSPNKESFETTYSMQQQAAVNVVLEAKGPASPFLPGKVPHCVAANKPILLLGPYYSETRRIFGVDYPYWSEIDDLQNIKNLIKELYQLWESKNGQLHLNRPDIVNYLSSETINNTFQNLKSE